MAEMGYGCVFGECTATPDYLLTDMTNGNTIALCGEHRAPGMIPLLAAELGVEPMGLYQVIEKYLAREAKKAERDVADAQAAQAAKGSNAPAPSPDNGQACDYCGNPLDDGESHVHAGKPNDGGTGYPDDDHEERGIFHGAGEEAL